MVVTRHLPLAAALLAALAIVCVTAQPAAPVYLFAAPAVTDLCDCVRFGASMALASGASVEEVFATGSGLTGAQESHSQAFVCIYCSEPCSYVLWPTVDLDVRPEHTSRHDLRTLTHAFRSPSDVHTNTACPCVALSAKCAWTTAFMRQNYLCRRCC